MEDLRCYTLHFYYRIKGADLFNGEDGFSTCSLEEAIKNMENITINKFNEISNDYRALVAKQCKVPIENIIPISRDEYKENTEEEDE